MTASRRFMRVRRLLAGVLVPSVVLAMGAPVRGHDQGHATDCHHPAHDAAAVSHANPGVPDCDHEAGTGCAIMAGCLVLPTAQTSGSEGFNTTPLFGFLSPFVNGALHGRLGFGPPTPPPNS